MGPLSPACILRQTPHTAIAKVSYHRSQFLSGTAEAAIDVDLRLITATIDAPMHDLRPFRRRESQLYDPVQYGAAQALGPQLRETGSWGVVHHSVRNASGLCAGVFRPRALKSVREMAHIALQWDRSRTTHWYEKRTPQMLT